MYRVDEAACTGCGDCVEACPAGAIALVNGRARIDGAACAECGSCADACPRGAIATAADLARSTEALATRVPAVAPSARAFRSDGLAQRPAAEVLPAEPQRRSVWPLVGAGLIWAARELLPEALAAWRASRAKRSQSASCRSATFGHVASLHRRPGRRHRRRGV